MSPSPQGGLLGSLFGFLGAGRAAKSVSDAAQAAEQGTLTAANTGTNIVTNQLGENSNALINAQNQAIGNVGNYGNLAYNSLAGNLGTAEGNTNPFIQGGQAGVGSLQNLSSNPYQVSMSPYAQTNPYAVGGGAASGAAVPPRSGMTPQAVGFGSPNGSMGGGGVPQFGAAPGSGQGGQAGQFSFMPTMQQLAATPGYQFALQQGENAIQNGNSASGLGESSNQNLDAAKYATGLASQTYQNAFQNAAQSFGLNQNAFNQTYQNQLQGFGANQNAYNQAFQNNLAGTQANFGMAYQPAQALTQAGLTGAGQQNQALLGFGGQAANQIYNTGLYGGNAIENTAQLNAQQGLQGQEFNANILLPAANQAGNFALAGAGANAAGILGQYNNLASGAAGLGSLAMGFLG